MKIALVSHPCPVLLHGVEPWSPVRTNTWPQSQVALAAALQNDFEIEFLDLRSLGDPSAWRMSLTEYLPPLQYGDYQLTRHLIGDYKNPIRLCGADVYVLTANFTAEANAVAETIRAIKTQWPKALVLVGGRDAAAENRQKFYFDAGTDYIGKGDGEISLLLFLRTLDQVSPLRERIIRGDIQRSFRPNLPDFSLKGLVLERFVESGGGPLHAGVLRNGGFTAYAETSRGCPRECTYCTDRQTAVWQLPVANVIKTMEHYQRAGCRMIGFTDPNLLIRNQGQLIKIFQAMREMGLVWEFPSGLEVQLFTEGSGAFKEALFDALMWSRQDERAFAGAHRLLVPLEDAPLHETQLIKLQRMQYHVPELILRLLYSGIPFFNIAIMIGGVAESEENRRQLEKNLAMLADTISRYPTRVNFSIFCTSPLPATPMGDDILQSEHLAYSIDDAPELWTVATSVINGMRFSAVETTEYRRQLLQRFGMLQVQGKVVPPSKEE